MKIAALVAISTILSAAALSRDDNGTAVAAPAPTQQQLERLEGILHSAAAPDLQCIKSCQSTATQCFKTCNGLTGESWKQCAATCKERAEACKALC